MTITTTQICPCRSVFYAKKHEIIDQLGCSVLIKLDKGKYQGMMLDRKRHGKGNMTYKKKRRLL